MTEDWGELATRESDGLVVSLLWSKSADRLKVAVVDTRRGEQFELEAAGTDALAVFHHPFATRRRRTTPATRPEGPKDAARTRPVGLVTPPSARPPIGRPRLRPKGASP
jgi:hypothetical protein